MMMCRCNGERRFEQRLTDKKQSRYIHVVLSIFRSVS